MAVLDEVKKLCDQLKGRGWRDLLLRVTDGDLDIHQSSKTKLADALATPLLNIDRSVPGFEGFHRSANRGIEGGAPGRSLLYHALACPDVHPTADGMPPATPNQANYPTLKQLDDLENYIYSLVADRADLHNTIVAVFAYQYRTASRTSHRRHADLAFSRTGVARVGTTGPNYDRSRRSFWVIPSGGGDALPVLPARYGAFLARRGNRGDGSVMGRLGGSGSDVAQYIFPVHKLFSGRECIKGRNLAVEFAEFHRNEKLRRIHALPTKRGGITAPVGFDIDKLPFVRDSTNGGKLVKLKDAGATTLVEPVPGDRLLRTVKQRNSVIRADQIVHFVVPPAQSSGRFVTSSLQISSSSNGDRLAPEFLNIRHEVDPTGPADQVPDDLNRLDSTAFARKLNDGGYAAAHFVDDTCDGCVEAVVGGLDRGIENQPAFSLVTAPDFMPLADQSEINEVGRFPLANPLTNGTLPPNTALPRPSTPTEFAFNHDDSTATAIVGDLANGPQVGIMGTPNHAVSMLPDGASNIFAPGWDTSRSRDAQGASHFTSSGLGSPFPEDAKLCAALSSFWPAVAPDNSRTFGNENFENKLPMLDEELGFHPKHERVAAGDVQSYHGWDGEFGPFFERVNGRLHVNHVPIERSDYVTHSLANRIRVSLTAEVQTEELVRRNQALRQCIKVIGSVSSQPFCLVVFRAVDGWSAFGGGSPALTGSGYVLEFAECTPGAIATSELDRVRRAVRLHHICHYADNGVAHKRGRQRFQFIPH